MNELITRSITGILYAATMLGTYLYAPPIAFTTLLIGIYIIIITTELPKLCTDRKEYLFLLPFYPTLSFALLIYSNHIPGYRPLILISFLTAWAHDTAAYLVGRYMGSHLLCPTISPRKTWEGLIGGFIGVTSILALFQYAQNTHLNTTTFITMSIALTISATAGDLFESWLKRRQHIKDSGTLLPAHGGLLDRLDSILFLIATLFIFQYVFKISQVAT